jgi:uncharacterized membrane protein (DUF4010 family)
MLFIADSLIVRMGLALAIGLAVGVVRGWQQRDDPEGSRTAGIRTFTLAGLLGGVTAAISQALNAPLILGMFFVVFGAIFAWFSYREVSHEKTFSVTGTVAALVVFALALAVVDDPVTAAAAGAATAGLLASREVLHSFLEHLSWRELRSALLLLTMTAIVLPILPDSSISTFDTLSLREMWLVTVLIAAISFAGYLAVKIWGHERGTLVTSIAGGLVSSTAVTIDFARRANAGEPTGLLAAGAMIAGIISILRVLAVVLVVAPGLLPQIIQSALPAVLAFGVFALFQWKWNRAKNSTQMELRNPFDLRPLVIFAIALMVTSLFSGWLALNYGTSGIILSSAAVALVDVDVAVLTASRLSQTAISAGSAASAILVALAVNSLARVVYAIVTGPRAFSARLAAATILANAAGAIPIFIAARAAAG